MPGLYRQNGCNVLVPDIHLEPYLFKRLYSYMYFLVQTVNYSTKCEQLEREYLIDQLNMKFRTLDRPLSIEDCGFPATASS